MSERSEGVVKVVLVDDHAIVRQGVRMLIESDPGLQVSGEAHDRASAVAVASREQPDVLLLDLLLDGENGLDLIAAVRAASPRTGILVLTGVRDPLVHRRALELGAAGLVAKEAAADVLLKAIGKVAAGGRWFDRSALPPLSSEPAPSERSAAGNPEAEKIAKLSPREREVAALIGEGLSNRKIAERLSISETTVRHHLTSVFAKLGVGDRLELLVYAYRHKLIRTESPS